MMPKVLSDRNNGRLPSVFIEPKAWEKLWLYIDLCEFEISGFGTVVQKKNAIFVTDIFILPQETHNNGAYVELDHDALNQFIYNMVKKGKDPSCLKFHWHSHADGHVFFSDIDLETLDNYQNTEFMISAVFNNAGQYKARIDFFKPVEISISIPLVVRSQRPSSATKRQCLKDIAKNVTVIPAPKSKDLGQHFPSHHGDLVGRMVNQTGIRGDPDNGFHKTTGYY